MRIATVIPPPFGIGKAMIIEILVGVFDSRVCTANLLHQCVQLPDGLRIGGFDRNFSLESGSGYHRVAPSAPIRWMFWHLPTPDSNWQFFKNRGPKNVGFNTINS